MIILVMSDSHSGLSFMRMAVAAVKPDAIIHLGDYFDDGEAIAQMYPDIPIHQVPGNCDLYRSLRHHPEILCYDVCGVRIFMTHGHRHNVKADRSALLYAARESKAAVALYGHTHEAEAYQEPDGMFVMNPGACGSTGGSVGLIETAAGAVVSCRILRYHDLEGLK